MRVVILDNRGEGERERRQSSSPPCHSRTKTQMTDRLIAFVQESCDVLVLKSYAALNFKEIDAVILSGSNDRINTDFSKGHFAHRILQDLLFFLQAHSKARCGVLGICYGMHILTKVFGGEVIRGEQLMKGEVVLPEFGRVMLNHHDYVVVPPHPFEVRLTRKDGKVLAMEWEWLGWVGIQHHVEATDDGEAWLFSGLSRFGVAELD